VREYHERYNFGPPCYGAIKKVFFVDIDGDGVEEAIVALAPSDDIWSGSYYWVPFRYTNGTWMQEDIRTIGFCVHPDDFYYRDDMKKQPLLFSINPVTRKPAAFFLNKGDVYWIARSFDQQEFDKLQKKGIIKPVRMFYWDGEDNITVQGQTFYPKGFVKENN